MAIPVFDSDLTLITACESTTDWNAYGGLMSPTSSTDYFREGTQSVSGDAKGATGRRVIAFDHSISTGTIDFSAANTYLYLWVWVATQPLVTSTATDGVAVYVSSSSGADTNYNEYTIGGSDAAWVGKGWKLFVIDVDGETADVTSGTCVTSAIAQVGLTVRLATTLGKSDGFAVDIMRYGSQVQVSSPEHTGASDLDFNDNGAGADTIVRPSGSFVTDGFEDGDTIVVTGTTNNNTEFDVTTVTATTLTLPTGVIVDEQNTSGLVVGKISLQGIADEDSAIGADTHYGTLYEDALGNKLGPNGCLIIGDEAGALNTWLASSNEIMLVDQERIPTLVNCLRVDKDTGTTFVRLGAEVGSGNDSRGVGGGLIRAIGTADFLIDGSLAFDEFSWWAGVIDGAGSILLQNTAVEWVGCTVQNSGQIVLDSGAEMREGFIVASIEAAGVGAILLNSNPTDPEFRDMTLINNVHAIESETNGPTTLDLRNITYAGNTADLRFNHTSGLLTVNVLENGDTPTTSDGGGGGTISVLNPKAVTFTGMRDNTEVRIYLAGTTTVVDGIENATAGSPDDRSFGWSVASGTSVDYVIHNVAYEHIRVESFSTTVDTSIPIQQRFDRNYSNP